MAEGVKQYDTYLETSGLHMQQVWWLHFFFTQIPFGVCKLQVIKLKLNILVLFFGASDNPFWSGIRSSDAMIG